MSVRSGSGKCFNSRRPLASKTTRSTPVAFAEYSAKFTPLPSQVAPSGYGRPGQTTLGILTQHFRGRAQGARNASFHRSIERVALLGVEFAFMLSRPTFQPLGGAFLPADSERQRQRQRDRREDDQEALSNDVAEPELVERDEDDEHENRPEREPAQERRVGERDVLAVGRHRRTHKPREIGAERKDDDRDDHSGNEQEHTS